MLAKSSRLAALVVVVAALAVSTAVSAEVGRTGAWVDEVILSEEASPATAITRLGVGEIDLFAYGVTDPDLFRLVQANPDLAYSVAYGSYHELTFNVAGPVFSGTGMLNPFAVKAIREAMNWLIDREYVVAELLGGMGAPRYTSLSTVFPDYAKAADTARAIELKYTHDPGRAKAVIAEEMEKLGAEMVNGVWHYNGEPVVIIVLIRTEDERREIGDYVASLLESIGFVTDRQYKTTSEAPLIWLNPDPDAGLFHIYTNSWTSTEIIRDLGGIFDTHYTPRGYPYPLWSRYAPEPRFDEVAARLALNDFASVDERAELIAEALHLSMEDSARVFIADRSGIIPRRAEIQATADLAGGVAGTFLWAHTLRFEDRVGGVARIALPGVLVQPWNPIAGSNWTYDRMPVRATGDNGTFTDPFTGLPMPQRLERAEVAVEEGLPVSKSSDWVELDFAPVIHVPEDAWVDWDPVEQRFITVVEKFPEGLTAKRKSVVYYPEDLYSSVKWHDGSPISLADFVLNMILEFDRGYEESPLFDSMAKIVLDASLPFFKGVRIVSADPLVIETYSDFYALDAEANVAHWFPNYPHGPGAWHSLALGIRAEADRQLAFSATKAEALGAEWMNYVAGPSVAVLAKQLEGARSGGYIPYEPTLGRYVSADEAKARWDNLARWYGDKGHFWIGTGPFYLERAYPVERIVHLKRNPDYPDPSDKWQAFAEPKIAEVEVFGDRRVRIGGAATFEVDVTFGGEPYPSDSISQVKYFVVSSSGEIAVTGAAEQAGEGWYEISLSAEDTANLSVGSNRLEVVVISDAVSIPSFESFEFVTTR